MLKGTKDFVEGNVEGNEGKYPGMVGNVAGSDGVDGKFGMFGIQESNVGIDGAVDGSVGTAARSGRVEGWKAGADVEGSDGSERERGDDGDDGAMGWDVDGDRTICGPPKP